MKWSQRDEHIVYRVDSTIVYSINEL